MTLHLLTVILLTFLVISALAIARMRELFPMVMLTGLYSLCSACLFMVLDAVDVAMTEAAVGAGVTTVLMLAALALTGGREKPAARKRTLMALGVTLATGAALVYATLDMPYFAAAATPVQQHPITAHYLYAMPGEIGVPNVVSAVLAGYRGYDTLGETTVIFTAAIAVLMLLGTRRRK
ncbi:MAG: DUF4040 domain-containing protein, partial [Salinisphaera sp.]|nr:DUF4040 domain-containing protein [Salinisphaera sp.]